MKVHVFEGDFTLGICVTATCSISLLGILQTVAHFCRKFLI